MSKDEFSRAKIYTLPKAADAGFVSPNEEAAFLWTHIAPAVAAGKIIYHETILSGVERKSFQAGEPNPRLEGKVTAND